MIWNKCPFCFCEFRTDLVHECDQMKANYSPGMREDQIIELLTKINNNLKQLVHKAGYTVDWDND